MSDQVYNLSSYNTKPNLRISFGGESNMWVHFYSKSKPNKFQRWMIRKLLGIVMEDVT